MGELSTKLRTPAILLAGVLAAGSAHAQNQPDRTIEQFKCKDVMREPDQTGRWQLLFCTVTCSGSPVTRNSMSTCWRSRQMPL